MKVKELITALNKLPQDMDVYFDDGGYYLEQVEVVGICKGRALVLLDHVPKSKNSIEKTDEELHKPMLIERAKANEKK